MARRRAYVRLLFASFSVALAACAEAATLDIVVLRDDGRPDVELDVTILPIDPQALYDSLARAAPTPRPEFPELEATMAGFRAQAPRPRPGSGGWEATRDSVEALADSLRHADRTTPAYRAAYGRLRSLYDRLGRRAAERDRADRSAFREDRELADRASRAADELRRWERIAYARYDELLAASLARSGRRALRVAADSAGLVRATLPPGRWWLRARRRVRDNPFQERRWNVPVTANRLVPVRVRITAANAQFRWRH